MALQAYVTIRGSKQGQFKGEGVRRKDKDAIPILSFSYDVQIPRDTASGQATGRRQHKPIVILKEWGAATPQLFQALVTNEVLTQVVAQFFKVNPNGEELIYQRITLTNAALQEIKYLTPEQLCCNDGKSQSERDTSEREQVSIVFEKIEIENVDGGTVAQDSWGAEE